MTLHIHHVKECVCVHHIQKCAIRAWKHASGNMWKHIIIWHFKDKETWLFPTIFVLNGVQKKHTKTSKRHFIMKKVCTTQHNTNHSTMHKNEEQTCKTCRISTILTKPTKPINQTQQNINKTIFNNHISISQHIHKIQEN